VYGFPALFQLPDNSTLPLIGSFISGMYLFWILVDVAAIFLFGSPIPAAL